jgi:uncharacterized protein
MKTLPYHIVRNSKIHGRGVFAKRPIRKGTIILEYTGPIISEKEADKVGISTENGHSHTMLFQLDKKRVINGNEGGDARYVNHGCDPNCETEQDGDHIYIKAVRAIKKGEELVYDYHLQVPGKITDEIRKEYACFCGSPLCRGTQIAAPIIAKQDKKDAKKKKKEEAKKLAAMQKVEKQKKAEEKKARKKDEEKKAKKKDKGSKKDKDIKKDKTVRKSTPKSKSKGKKKDTALSLMVDKKPVTGKDKKKDSKKRDKKKKK